MSRMREGICNVCHRHGINIWNTKELLKVNQKKNTNPKKKTVKGYKLAIYRRNTKANKQMKYSDSTASRGMEMK